MAKPQLSAVALEGHLTGEATSSPEPNLASLPPTFILATNLSEPELHEFEDTLVVRGAPLTYDIKAANLVIGNISKERRARFELKRGNVPLMDDEERSESVTSGSLDPVSSPMAVKRRKLKDTTPELIENVTTVGTGNNKDVETTVTGIHPNQGNYPSRSNSQCLLVNISFISKFVVGI